MASLNKVMLIGGLGRDPEIRYTASGTAVASFSLATTDKIKNKSGEWEEKTEWHNITLWSKLAELAGEYLAKGKQIYLEGRLTTRKWSDKDGKDRYTVEIVGEKMEFLSPKDGGTTSRPKGGGSGGAPRDGYEEPTFDGGDIPFLSGPSFYDHR